MDQSGQKEERTNFCYGHRSRGTIKFGHLWMDEESGLQTAIQSGVMLQAFDARHYVSLDISGQRKGWIVNRCPGTYSILCGTDLPDDSIGYFLLTEKGDIVIEAPNGAIRMIAQSIDLIAKGTDNSRGNINIESNQSVNINTQTFDVKAKSGARIFTPFTLDIVANTSFRLTSNFIRGLSATSQILPDKNNPNTPLSFNTNSLYSSSVSAIAAAAVGAAGAAVGADTIAAGAAAIAGSAAIDTNNTSTETNTGAAAANAAGAVDISTLVLSTDTPLVRNGDTWDLGDGATFELF